MSSAKSWFVQMGFGATLGPMPDDALQEMVRSGAIVGADLVRDGTHGEWRVAAEIPGLFDEAPLATLMPESDRVVIPIADDSGMAVPPTAVPVLPQSHLIPPTCPDASLSAGIHSHQSPQKSEFANHSVVPAQPPGPNSAVTALDSLQGVVDSDYSDDEMPAPKIAPLEDALIAAWKSDRARSKEELSMRSLAAEMDRADIEEKSPLELTNDRSDNECMRIIASPTNKLVRTSKPRPAFSDQISGVESRSHQQSETSTQKWHRWRRSLPRWQIIAVVVAVLFSTWWFWPRSTSAIYERYVSIWDEWKVHRAEQYKDKNGWERFLKRTEVSLNDSIPWLEKHSNSADPQSQRLLLIGRDCLRKMLKQPKQVASGAEKQLEFLLNEARINKKAVRLNPTIRRNAASVPNLDSEHATELLFESDAAQQGSKAVPTPKVPPSLKSGVMPDGRSRNRTPE